MTTGAIDTAGLARKLREHADTPVYDWEDWAQRSDTLLREAAAALEATRSTGGAVGDEMVERAAQALYENDDPWNAAFKWPETQGTPASDYRRLARAALTAALGGSNGQ